MFSDNYPESYNNISECRPDPEEELQRVRKLREKFQKGKSLLVEMERLNLTLHINIQGINPSMFILGNLEARILELKFEEEHWLDIINKEAEK